MLKERTSQILFNYWNEVRGDAIAPRRLDIEPSRISSILPDTFILEFAEDSGCRFRLAGTRICEYLGTDLRGTDFLDLWEEEEEREAVGRLVESIVSQGAAGLLEFTIFGHDGEQASVEALLLPLLHDGRVTRLLGAMSIAGAAEWLGHGPLRRVALDRACPIWPDGRPHKLIERADRQSPFLARAQAARIVRFDRLLLRVYDGGRTEPKSKP